MSVRNFKVDGMNRNEPIAYEFYSCVWHGCERCFPDREKKMTTGNTAAEDYQNTVSRRLAIEATGVTVVEKWECDFRREMKTDPVAQRVHAELQPMQRLQVRDAFFGGRTNAIKLYHKCVGEEKIEYVDVLSLYPWTNKYGAFPLGHPIIRTEGLDAGQIADRRSIRGLLKCKVLPPRRLFHPLLPRRSNNKLCFPLCGPCADNQNKSVCTHSDDERAFWGTWATLEVYTALDLGYELLQVAEAWHYEQWAEYDGKNPESGVFTKYINTFLKLKQESSSWPSWVKSEEDKKHYIDEYEEQEGIRLEPSNIEMNAGLRQVSKLCLNSFWGKFGQRSNLSKTTYLDDSVKFFKMIHDAELDVGYTFAVHDDMVCVKYTQKDEFVDALPNTNTLVAIYTTCHARLKLYSYLHKLKERVLYFDTDSVIYLTRPGDQSLPLGENLGDLTNELKAYGKGAHISEFIGAGPKQYAYKIEAPSLQEPKLVVKIRGIRINKRVLAKINYFNLKKAVKVFATTGIAGNIEILVANIVPTADASLVTQFIRKQYRVVYKKRRALSDYTTVPYGFQ